MNRHAVAEHVLACLGKLLRRVGRMDRRLRQDGWDRSRALAGLARESTARMSDGAADEVQRLPAGRRPLNLVNPQINRAASVR